ncbi:hypothetical protein Q8A73_001687 [Channa argus]|nr:hypothetical protein Q8A73_001687 [Channa argus]
MLLGGAHRESELEEGRTTKKHSSPIRERRGGEEEEEGGSVETVPLGRGTQRKVLCFT